VQELVCAQVDESERDAVRVCLADAFATYVVGPAYACAVLLMRLDPVRALSDDDRRLDARRAAVVLYTLDHLNRVDEASGHFDDIIGRLRTGWESALRQAGWSERIEDTDEVRGGLDLDEIAAVRDLVSEVAHVLGRPRAFPVEEWNAVIELSEALAERRADTIELDPTIDPRHVLNAAWRCRWQREDLRNIDMIETDAMELWERLHAPVRTTSDSEWLARPAPPAQAAAGRTAPQSAGVAGRPPNPHR
jgi:hypothetical protein